MNERITLYRERLNLDDANLVLIDPSGAGVGIVYRVTLPSGEPLILKVCPREEDYAREVYFLTHLSGVFPLPRIVQLVDPEEGIDGALLMECLPGEPLKAYTDALAYEIGAALAAIHHHHQQGYGDLTRPKELASNPIAHFSAKFAEGMAECQGHLPPALFARCQHYFEQHIRLLDSVDGPCIIHRDFRPSNVLILAGKLSGIVDWSSGRAGFAGEDFCPLEHGEWPTSFAKSAAFFSGYASVRPVPDYHEVMPLLCIHRTIAVIGFTLKQGTWDTTNARPYQFNRQFLDQF